VTFVAKINKMFKKVKKRGNVRQSEEETLDSGVLGIEIKQVGRK